ncbi:DNA methyltransferase [Nonomuraea fuscirosea]|uniref:DNA methyltransferase n=1 Tax=Nonomuraea fuscirosea TaxID=1291556 RepID=UPI003716DF05
MSALPQSSAHEWPQEPGSGRGRSHGTSSTEPFDRWFRYPAGFASDYVAMLLDSLGLAEGTVVDCFAGSGVTGTAARQRGLDFVGIEAHPLVAEVASLKLIPTATPNQVRALSDEIRASAQVMAKVDAKALTAETDLVKRSFDEETLCRLVGLRRLIQDKVAEPAAPYLKWALLGTLRDVADVKVGWPYQRPGVSRKPRYTDPLARLMARAEMIAEDLELLDQDRGAAEMVVGDSRNSETWAGVTDAASACVASPPYLNNFDYADATRLELYFWGEVRTWADMCREVRSDMLTATTQQSSVGEKASAIAALEAMGDEAARQVLKLVDAIGEVQKSRSRRAKEYDRVAPAYFVAMRQILENLYAHLAPEASVLWLVGDSAPYGVYVDTPRLIGELAVGAGFEFVDDVQLRVRGNRWGSNTDRHKVVLSERLLILRRHA